MYLHIYMRVLLPLGLVWFWFYFSKDLDTIPWHGQQDTFSTRVCVVEIKENWRHAFHTRMFHIENVKQNAFQRQQCQSHYLKLNYFHREKGTLRERKKKFPAVSWTEGTIMLSYFGLVWTQRPKSSRFGWKVCYLEKVHKMRWRIEVKL